MNKIRKGDQVEVISGSSDDKGKRGEVIRVNPEEEIVVVQGVHLQTKHQRQVQAQGRTVRLAFPVRVISSAGFARNAMQSLTPRRPGA
jgi:ribosomal protein L24